MPARRTAGYTAGRPIFIFSILVVFSSRNVVIVAVQFPNLAYVTDTHLYLPYLCGIIHIFSRLESTILFNPPFIQINLQF